MPRAGAPRHCLSPQGSWHRESGRHHDQVHGLRYPSENAWLDESPLPRWKGCLRTRCRGMRLFFFLSRCAPLGAQRERGQNSCGCECARARLLSQLYRFRYIYIYIYIYIHIYICIGTPAGDRRPQAAPPFQGGVPKCSPLCGLIRWVDAGGLPWAFGFSRWVIL